MVLAEVGETWIKPDGCSWSNVKKKLVADSMKKTISLLQAREAVLVL